MARVLLQLGLRFYQGKVKITDPDRSWDTVRNKVRVCARASPTPQTIVQGQS